MLMRVYQHRKGAVMNSKLKTPAVEQLFDAILSLENKEECAAFFEDLCTINELLSLSQRFEVAKMLREKKTYLDIAEDRRFYSNHQPCKPLVKLRQRRL